jgi:hypothetical protein
MTKIANKRFIASSLIICLLFTFLNKPLTLLPLFAKNSLTIPTAFYCCAIRPARKELTK